MAPNTLATILLVDDDAVNRQLMAWMFRNAGYRVVEAGTGEEALSLARQRPDLAVLDVNLPDMSGFDVCRQIKADPATRGISVVHLSAVFVASDDRTQGLEQGADAYLVKPVEHRELLATIKAMLRIRAAEEAARRAAQEWRTTFDAISDAVCLLDASGRICRCNQALCERLGQDAGLLLGRQLDEVVREVFGAESGPALDWMLAADKDGRRSGECKLGTRFFRVTADPIPSDGAARGRVVILRDITQRKELEELVRQGQRLEAVGRLAGGVAHEFNNLLTAILGNVSMLAVVPRDPDDVAKLATIERAAWRAADLTKQLLGFSRQALLWLRPVDPTALLDEAVAAVRAGLPSGVKLRDDRPATLPMIQADPDFLKQVLQQLCRQAVEAMPSGGVLELTASDVVIGVSGPEGGPDVHPGAYVLFSVTDTSAGLTPEAVDKVFEPFYTTGDGPGGLSLAWVHGIAKQHRGWVECHSEVGRGTRFDLYIPCPEEPVAGETPVAAMVAPRSGPRRVLLADDNATLLALAAQYLRQGGYEVVTADDGLQAVEFYAREHDQIDLVILDQATPHLTGQDALRRMRRIQPRLRALIATGSGGPRVSPEEVQGVVSKPYRERDLLQAVRSAFERN